MAKKRKLSKRQKAARKRKSYLRAEYYKNYDALEYLRNFMDVKGVLIPKEITEASVRYIRKIYKEVRPNLKEYVDITTGEVLSKPLSKQEMAKQVREKYPEREYRQFRPQKVKEQPPSEPFNPDEEYIEDFKSRLRTSDPKVDKSKNREAKVEKAKNKWLDAIDDAVKKFGSQIVAKQLASDVYIQRIENIPEQYAYELIDDVNDYVDELDDLVNSSVGEALSVL